MVGASLMSLKVNNIKYSNTLNIIGVVTGKKSGVGYGRNNYL